MGTIYELWRSASWNRNLGYRYSLAVCSKISRYFNGTVLGYTPNLRPAAVLFNTAPRYTLYGRYTVFQEAYQEAYQHYYLDRVVSIWWSMSSSIAVCLIVSISISKWEKMKYFDNFSQTGPAKSFKKVSAERKTVHSKYHVAFLPWDSIYDSMLSFSPQFWSWSQFPFTLKLSRC